jgi:hypothetical protein
MLVVVVLQAAVLLCGGYLTFYILAEDYTNTSYLIMAALMFIAGNGSAATYISALGMCIPHYAIQDRP